MASKFYALLTNRGATKLAQAAALGTKINITQMAVGDGGGVLPTPNATQTALIGEKRRASINTLSIDPVNTNQVIAEQIIPEDEGGFWIREIGLFDSDGELLAIANCAETYKPLLQEGSGRTQTIRMILIVSSTDAVTIKIDPSVVLATRQYADNLITVHLAASDPHPQYAPKASPVLTGTPKAPTAGANDNSTQIATTAFARAVAAALIEAALKAPIASPNLTGTPTAPTAAAGNNSAQVATTAFVASAIAALAGSAPATLDTLKEIADALGNDPNFSATMLNALAGKMDKAKNGSDIADVGEFIKNLSVRELLTGIVGDARNLKMSVSAASATATVSADALIVGESLDGRQYKLSGLNLVVNLAATGAGGMDTGAVTSGFVALYVIYNPATGAKALLAVNTTSVVATEVYSGVSMPAGYTASALISVWPVTSSGFAIGFQTGRHITLPFSQVFSATSVIPNTPTALSLSAVVPKNAQEVDLFQRFVSTSTELQQMAITSTPGKIGLFGGLDTPSAAGQQFGSTGSIKLVTPQTIYYYQSEAFSTTRQLYVTGYSF